MNENERPASNAGEKRSDRRPGGKFDGQRRPYAGKSADRRTDRPQGGSFRKDDKRPYDGKTASGPRKFDRDGQHRSQPSGNRCNACLGTASMITREQLEKLKNTDWFTPQFDRPLNDEEAEESEVDHP